MAISLLTNAPVADILSAHRPGRSLAAAVQARQRPLIEAHELLLDALRADSRCSERFAEIFATRAPNQFTDTSPESMLGRSAWALINMFLLASAAGESTTESLRDAERWFLGSRAAVLHSLAECVAASADRACVMLLSVVTIDPEFRGLLPYILEPFGFAHRLNAKRGDEFGEQQEKKRTAGVFYTPGDVASAIVSEAVGFVARGGRAIDPACGTGVFLITLLRELRRTGDSREPLQIASDSLYGMDVSDLAIESCAFVLAHDCIGSAQRNDPWAVWQTLRSNLWAVDTTTVHFGDACADPIDRMRAKRVLYESSEVPRGAIGRHEQSASLLRERRAQSLWDVFPEAAPGFEAIITNPPYVRGSAERANLYIEMIAQALRIAHPEQSVVGAVLPLSIAFSSDEETRHLRLALTRDAGSCRFAFFDREPHGLFGEEVKTRSAIVIRKREPGLGPARVQTTPLLRLTSRTRSALLASLPAVDLGQHNIRGGVPKLGNVVEVEAYRHLTSTVRRPVLRFASVPFQSCLADTSISSVYVGPVAYNFVNVARRLQLSSIPPGAATRSSFLRCELVDSSAADSVFALFSSRVSYWLWNVEGDGFHVSKRFIDFIASLWNTLSQCGLAQLSERGLALWEAISSAPIVSRNAGAWSVAFSPVPHRAIVAEIDHIVTSDLGMSDTFADLIERAALARIVVDPAEKKRRQLVS